MTAARPPWKIARDPYFSLVYARGGEDAVTAAGFFDDDDTEDAPLDDVDWLSTPFPKKRPVPEGVVLLATGGFCPVHDGHLAMMEAARRAVEASGRAVVGGYLSPGHDMYLALKCGDAAIPASERLRLCAEKTRGSDWLSVDPWEALHRRVSVNYTDVTARLERYLRAHVEPTLEVMYVCGADNARFASAFLDRGGCVVVGRPGGEGELARARRALEGHPRVIFASGDHPAQSRALRSPRHTTTKRRIVVRREGLASVRTLGLTADALDAFQRELLDSLQRQATVRTVPVEPRRQSAAKVLSLDPMVPGDANLAISRLFALGGYERLGHVARPGSPPLAEQIAQIPAGDYVLHDDDRMTGETIDAVRALLPARVTVAAVETAVAHDADEDVLDARDVLLGADDGGLVVALASGVHARAPYLLPYVDPAVRASVAAPLAFSRAMWELNARTFEGTGKTIANLPLSSRVLFAQFAPAMPLPDLCWWHAERLGSFLR